MDPMSGFDARRPCVYITAQKQYTAVQKMRLHYSPETVHCSTKDAYTIEITFLAL